MRVALAWALALALASPVAAQELRPIPTQIDGQEGLWFPLELAREVVEHERERQTLLRRMRLVDDALSLAHEEIALIREARDASAALVRSLRVDLERAERAAEWYIVAVLWGLVGLVVGVVGAVIVAVSL